MIRLMAVANRWMLLALAAGLLGTGGRLLADDIDLSKTVVVVPDGLSGPEHKATRLLVDEVLNRSQLEWKVSLRSPSGEVPVIAVGPARLLESFPHELREQAAGIAAGNEKEGFRYSNRRRRQSAGGRGGDWQR